jgi:ADP-heptose:LPS heptosyltransferase
MAPERPALLAGLRRPLLVIHPGAGARRKCWARSGFETLAARWRRDGGGVVELVGPAESASRRLAFSDRTGSGDLPEVAALLASCDAFLGNDSGVSHLAGAVGARGVAVFGATNPDRWRPISPAILAVHGGVPRDDGIAPTEDDIARVWDALAAPADLDNPTDAT